eukprot:GHVU01137215.1.p1 GENE.GHVU01137215.1~~GHVU01137215.1.p1  ORF type:complete len:161 (+),score=2.86 GHVU01137215.1:2-484(+)
MLRNTKRHNICCYLIYCHTCSTAKGATIMQRSTAKKSGTTKKPGESVGKDGGHWTDRTFQAISEYYAKAQPRIRLIDGFVVILLLLSAILVVFFFLGGSFPFNSYLAALTSSVGTAVLTVCLRMQITDRDTFANVTIERAFADFLICNLVLHVMVFNFLG